MITIICVNFHSQVGAALAEYCAARTGVFSDDHQVVTILRQNRYPASSDAAVHVTLPLPGDTPEEKMVSMNISEAMNYLRMGHGVPQSILAGLCPR